MPVRSTDKKVEDHRKKLRGADHPNWKGGRLKSSSGYIIVRVASGHHLRMNNGYAYEHQIVAERKIGRQLRVEELVHHINGIKTDNREENIEVLSSIADHKLAHRKVMVNNRIPGEKNELVHCDCGCGKRFLKFDEYGRPRRYISGHWRRGRKGGWNHGNE